MEYIIERTINEVQPEPEAKDYFTIKYLKEAVNVDGVKVEVIDDQRTDQITVAQLEAQKVSLQNQITEIDVKLGIIGKL
jgi:GH35 family endo-1,4-beta-xylanase